MKCRIILSNTIFKIPAYSKRNSIDGQSEYFKSLGENNLMTLNNKGY